MKYIIILLIGILSSQDTDTNTFLTSGGTTGSVGTVTINGEIYNQLSLRPEIPIGKLGVGLDIYLYFNDDGMYLKSWDFSSGGSAYRTIIDKIYYLRWGQPGNNLYFMVGALPSVTLGQGILVNNYANIMEYPQVRQIGLNLRANIAGVGVEVIHSNFKSDAPGVLGVRGSYEVLPKISIGVAFVTDLNQLAGLPDADGDDYPDYYDYYPDDSDNWDDSHKYRNDYIEIVEKEGLVFNEEKFQTWYQGSEYYNDYNPSTAKSNSISGLALDVTYTLTQKITLYSQFGKLIGKIESSPDGNVDPGWGLVPIGARAQLGPVDLLAEYRFGSRKFLFNYWDRSYDLNRVVVTSDTILTRESQLYHYGTLNGFYVNANIKMMNLFNYGVGYQNMQGEKWNKNSQEYESGASNQTFLTTIGINPSLIPKLGKAEAFYQQSNVPDPFKFVPNVSTIWGYNVGVELSSGVMLVYQARTTYISDLDNPGEFLPIKSLQIETQFVF